MEQNATKKYFIKTFGCQANEADSNTIAGVLESLDFELLSLDAESANEHSALLNLLPRLDLFIVNTCSVRQKSEDKTYGIGKVVSELKKSGKKIPYMVMAGCMVGSVTGQRKRYNMPELQKKTPWVNLYINPSQISELPNFLYEDKVVSDWAYQKFNPENIMPAHTGGRQAFVNISYGCDNFCTFCVVPYSRGKEISRTKEEILREIKHLTIRGVTEVVLCGQNVNSWGLSVGEKFKIRTGSNQKLPFADLLRDVAKLPEITKISFISSNPFDFTEDLIDAIRNPKISNYMHIAVQSGNNEMLKKMNRRHTIEEFVDLLGRIKNARPDVEFGTDIIVGFPGETREQFMDTAKLFETTPFNVAYISMYSTRKGTFAEKNFTDDISLEEKKWRSAYLNDVYKKTKPHK
jgi:tRNA-2-methylthio-N6-dimethylallyladenosine synthase